MTVTAQDINALQGADLPTKALLQRLILDIAAAGGSTAATPTVAGVVKQTADVVALTDNSGGVSGGNAVAVVPAAVASTGTDVTAATVVSTNASITAIKNDIATLTAKLNALRTGAITAGQMA